MEPGKKTVTVELQPSQILTLIMALTFYNYFYSDVCDQLPNKDCKDVILSQLLDILDCTECLENSFNKISEVL